MVLRTGRLATALAAAGLAAALTSGCAGPADSGATPATITDATRANPASPAASPPDATRAGQTLWRLLDAQGEAAGQLPDDDPDVVSIRSLIVRHSDLIDNRRADTARQSVEAELTAYTPAFSRELADQEYPAKVESMYEDNGLAVHLDELAWYPATVSANRTTAVFETTSTFTFTRAASSWLKARKLELERPYVERRRISLTRTASGWRISAIERQPLERG